MLDVLEALKDYQHILLIIFGLLAYFKWQEKRKEIAKQVDDDREHHKDLIEETIKAALHNGISQKMKEIIHEHEKFEALQMDRILSNHVSRFHDRRRNDKDPDTRGPVTYDLEDR